MSDPAIGCVPTGCECAALPCLPARQPGTGRVRRGSRRTQRPHPDGQGRLRSAQRRPDTLTEAAYDLRQGPGSL